MATKKEEKYKETFSDIIPENALKLISKKRGNLVISKNSKKTFNNYKKKVFFYYYDGYDFLENLCVTRHFIQKKYGIDWNALETLLYLYPKAFFTRKDYINISKQLHLNKMDYFLNKDMIKLANQIRNCREPRLYCLSPIGRNVVTDFYEYLSGEKKFPDDIKKNPLVHKNMTKEDEKRLKMINDLRNLTVPQSRKIFWRESNPDVKS